LTFDNNILKEIYRNLFLQEKDINNKTNQKEEEKPEKEGDLFDEDENKINIALNNIFKQGVYIGFIKDSLNFNLQFQTSIYLINTRVLLQEYFFYQLLISDNGNNSFVEKLKLNPSSLTLNNLFTFISEQFCDNIEKKAHADLMLQKIDYINSEIIPLAKELTKDIIGFDDKNIINEIKIVNFFKNNNFIIFCLDYLPLIYFSIIEHIYFFIEENSNIQENKNISCIIDLVKIISYYYATAYVEFLKKENEEFINIFFRDIILYDINIDNNFSFRKKLKPQEICEKLIDTEALYTVFERC